MHAGSDLTVQLNGQRDERSKATRPVLYREVRLVPQVGRNPEQEFEAHGNG
jgi:hypothetical protein